MQSSAPMATTAAIPTDATTNEPLRYVPLGAASLASDAPGWSAAEGDAVASGEEERGPVCWKCRGAKSIEPKGDGRRKRKERARKVAAAAANVDEKTLEEDDAVANDGGKRPRRTCPVCLGTGHLPVKTALLESRSTPGAITSRRRRPRGWMERGHVPAAVRSASSLLTLDDCCEGVDAEGGNSTRRALTILKRANGDDSDYHTPRRDVPIVNFDKRSPGPPPAAWLPVNPGEQLCNLVGRWRILQRVGSHRWTTDDLVTAYVAGRTFALSCNKNRGDANAGTTRNVRYLDLGTGNGSVLQMVYWYLLSKMGVGEEDHCATPPFSLEAAGVEARSEAVGLARRSLSFNLGTVELDGKLFDAGPVAHDVGIVRGDFRDLVALSKSTIPEDESGDGSRKDEGWSMERVASKRYDLITGTPPYFRVDFSSSKGATKANGNGNNKGSSGKEKGNEIDDKVHMKEGECVTSAVIRQGGMPTSIQSAPARCEFRGGVEAYCAAASALLKQSGIFVVCENWLNDRRVYEGARAAGLDVTKALPVMGGARRGKNLFAVYVMRKKIHEDDTDVDRNGTREGVPRGSVVMPSLVVRDREGKYTDEYAEVLEDMSIPVVR